MIDRPWTKTYLELPAKSLVSSTSLGKVTQRMHLTLVITFEQGGAMATTARKLVYEDDSGRLHWNEDVKSVELDGKRYVTSAMHHA